MPRNILYIETNQDGTVGGSHYSLFLLVKNLDREIFKPAVLFYQENSMVKDFKNISDVYIYNQPNAFSFENGFPALYKIGSRTGFIKTPLLICQKTYNFVRFYIPNLIYIYKFLKKHRIDLVHVNNYPDLSDWLIVSKLLKIKIVSHMRGFWDLNTIRKMFFGWYDKVISISNWVTDQLNDRNFPSKNVVLIHNGIDIESVNVNKTISENILKKWNFPPATPIIGVVGNIRKWKGQHVAVESMRILSKKYKNIRCIFVGEISNSPLDKEYLQYLKELAVKHGVNNNIVFTGFKKNIYDVINNLDILIHTSILPEPFGRVILEGMVLRKPVIATNHGGPVEIIEDGISGYLVPTENPELLSEKISFLIENNNISVTLGENARKRVEEKFSIQKNVKNVEEIYSHLLNS